MRTLQMSAGFILVAMVGVAAAQGYTPRVEVGLGYSYSSMQVPNSTKRANMHGVVIPVTTNLNPWLGVEAEFGTHYHCISACWQDFMRVENPDERNDSLTFLVGPKVTLSRNRRVVPWAHGLVGVSKVSYSSIYSQDVSVRGLGVAVGGGIDVPLSRVTIRALQVDYLRMPGIVGNSNNMRVGVGMVFRFGERKSGGAK